MRFIHTADWHIGMGASHVPTVADAVRAARLETARNIINLARERQCDFILIAGDLFDSNAVSNELVHQVLYILGQADPVQVYILPGNHDHMSPGSVYQRPAFAKPPSNVHVLKERTPIYMQGKDVALLPAPVMQKRQEVDPTRDLPKTPEAKYRIGVAHGSLQIEGKYQRDDHPIALDAATREELDYLALGHWHSYVENGDAIMPGTPEPMNFDDSGYVILVEMDGAEILVDEIPINTLSWLEKHLELTPDMDMLSVIRGWENELTDKTLLHLEVTGFGNAHLERELDELSNWLNARVLYLSLDTSQLRGEATAALAQELIAPHPFLAGILSDLSQLLIMAEPESSLMEVAVTDHSLRNSLDRDVLRELLAEADYDPAVVQSAFRQLIRLAEEVGR